MDDYEKTKVLTKRYKKIKILLKEVYGYESFKPRQYEIINKIISGEDVCAILPTGHGKSICFQIPALYIDKPAIVVSPLISLMDDQRLILSDLGISSCCYNSTIANKYDLKREIMQCKYKFIYITPESIVKLKDFFIELEKKQGISLIAIDEAHCISSYGYDFRKDYRQLTFFKDILPNVPILALTATATKTVGKDICKVLGFTNNKPIQTSFDRDNLYLEVRIKCDKKNCDLSQRISQDIVPVIKEHDNESIIIYCVTRKETVKISEILKNHNIGCGVYHGGLDVSVKQQAHHDFVKGKVKVIAATIAFGMGINKSDVRVVIHYGSPKNIEGYYQEIGRAGRDGKKAYCYTFFNFRDFEIQKNLMANNNNDSYQETQMKLLEHIKRYMETKKCRRAILLRYFGDDPPETCDFCDNCLNVHKARDQKMIYTKQNVEKEAKQLIDLIESTKPRSFGITMYINILRGSANKSITPTMRKSSYYGKGSHRSVAWWKEMSDGLIKQNFIQQACLKTGRFPIQVLKVTRDGLTWSNMTELDGLLEFNDIKLEPINMLTSA